MSEHKVLRAILVLLGLIGLGLIVWALLGREDRALMSKAS